MPRRCLCCAYAVPMLCLVLLCVAGWSGIDSPCGPEMSGQEGHVPYAPCLDSSGVGRRNARMMSNHAALVQLGRNADPEPVIV